MAALLQDVRYALRLLIKSPGFTAIVACTLAVGIGATTALFSVISGVLLNPLPYPQASELVALYEKNAGMTEAPISYLNFLDWQRASKTFAAMAIYRHQDYNLTGSGHAERVNGLMVSAEFFSTLGVHPAVGRDFNRRDDLLGGQPVVLLSDAFWHRHFGGDPAAVGRSLELEGIPRTIAGVLPPGFSFYDVERDVFVPIGQWDDPSFLDRRVDVSAHAVGRLRPGVTLTEASGEMDAIAQNLSVAFPEADKGVGISVIGLREDLVGNVQPVL